MGAAHVSDRVLPVVEQRAVVQAADVVAPILVSMAHAGHKLAAAQAPDMEGLPWGRCMPAVELACGRLACCGAWRGHRNECIARQAVGPPHGSRAC